MRSPGPRPKVGEQVFFYPNGSDDEAEANGAVRIPAWIVAVSSENSFQVNLKILPNGPGTLWRINVTHKLFHYIGESFWDYE